MAEKLRKELCAEQVLFCTNVCGGEGFTREAFCNTNTLGSKCVCSNGAEAAIQRYQWPVFQRVCEAQRAECRTGCDRAATGDKATCFNSCDARMACGSDRAPPLQIMVNGFDDATAGSPKVQVKVDNSGAAAPDGQGEGKDAKIKGKKDTKDGPPKRRGGPLPTGSTSGAAALWPAAAGAVLAVGASLI
ncbi:hypothetical protein GGF46_004611 [Coemansia sp. RSA 552]|nr:hypothetical protein GGF46_004611 [Coemansia sp. RSA 552]